ncbi:DUF6415 family natural product biosynthesis protein [Streptomyces xantholiticus]|uniref:DUF6415 family natural product biosynthesis protein n=1 Tax=Streptomyces xantholiticus TaxID=68285 RepID=A0ABV1UZS8_9ACTN
MNATAIAPPRTFDAGTATMQRVLASLRRSVDDEAVMYDDLESVLGPYARLCDAQTVEITARLHGALSNLLPAARKRHGLHPAVVRAEELRERVQPPDPDDARASLRRLALATLDVLDLLGHEPVPLC